MVKRIKNMQQKIYFSPSSPTTFSFTVFEQTHSSISEDRLSLGNQNSIPKFLPSEVRG